ncbi:MAG: hypothetical protein WA608_02725, partial [Candidatus Acidiferrales bacterium]
NGAMSLWSVPTCRDFYFPSLSIYLNVKTRELQTLSRLTSLITTATKRIATDITNSRENSRT